MEKTETLFRNWQNLLIAREDIEEELEKINQWLRGFLENNDKEKNAEYVDTIIANQLKKSIRFSEFEKLNTDIKTVENELKNRLNSSNSESIRIPSRQDQVMDSVIYIDGEGNLKSIGRM